MPTPFRFLWFCNYSARNWDTPENASFHWRSSRMYCETARVLETRGLFDAFVLADSAGIPTEYGGNTDAYVKLGLDITTQGDPIPLFAAMAAGTAHLGLVSTLSTSFYPPRLLAQVVATVDHLSAGRSGWNIVTSKGAYNARNYGFDDMPSDTERYDRADDFVDTVTGLWAGARADGLEGGPESSASDADRLRVPPLPQGRPVFMQAGGSERGRTFAARHAEIVITHANSVTDMKAFRDDMRARMARIGRDPASCKFFFTVKTVIAATHAEAQAMYDAEKTRLVAGVEAGLVNYSSRIGYDVSHLPLDEPLPADLPVRGSTGIFRQYAAQAGGAPTLREIGRREALKESYLALGSAAQVADQLAAAMEEVGGDGFAVRETPHPSNVMPVVDLLLPILRERGLVRAGYRHGTFRENLLDPDFHRPAAPAGLRQEVVG